MKEIQLTQGLIALVDDDDYEIVANAKWFCSTVRLGNKTRYYASRTVKGCGISLMHRLIMEAEKGDRIDHKDGNGLNNQRHNLRFATHQQNMMNSNTQKTSLHTSRFKGVFKSKPSKKFTAQIQFNNKGIHLGQFEYERDAAIAYNDAAIKYFGDFAVLNIV